MSIINDALKKTQDSLNKNGKKHSSNIYDKLHEKNNQNSTIGNAANAPLNSEKGSRQKNILLTITIVFIIGGLLAGVVAYIGQESIKSFNTRKETDDTKREYNPKPLPEIEYTDNTFILNGTIQTGPGKTVALINNEIYELGDEVNGKRIINITMEKVELLDGDDVMTLKVSKP